MGAVSISIILPMLNEEKNISQTLHDLIAQLEMKQIPFQLIVVDDGSADNSFNIVQELHDPRICLIKNPVNMGIGESFIRALKEVQLPFVTWFPSDGEFAAIELCKMIEHVNENTVAVATPINSIQMRSIGRVILSRTYRYLVSKIFDLDLAYYNGMAIYPTNKLGAIQLLSRGFTFPLEMIIRMHEAGMNFVQVPVQLQKRQGGKSKAIKIKVLRDVVVQIFRLWHQRL